MPDVRHRLLPSPLAGGDITQGAEVTIAPRRTGPISLVVSDVDGTLVTHDKVLLSSTIEAARRLRRAGIGLAIVSSRPPRGIAEVARMLALDLFGGFNGAFIVDGALEVLERHVVPPDAARLAVEVIGEGGADVWVFDGEDWLATNPDGHYVPRERHTVGFDPTIVPNFDGRLSDVGKIVGSAEDFDLLARIEEKLSKQLGNTASARRSQKYYLDVTHPTADKGHAVGVFAKHWGVPLEQVAVLGDMANDLPMFAVAGLSIAMGNAPPDVQAKADHVTGSNDSDGWASAIDQFILPASATRPAAAGETA
jgi:Cof subfamily protein (haloacid dehalogenase superfamily)